MKYSSKEKKDIYKSIVLTLFTLCKKQDVDYPNDFEMLLQCILFDPEYVHSYLQSERKKKDRCVRNTDLKGTTHTEESLSNNIDKILSRY